MDLALNNLQWLICHKTKPNQTKAMYSKVRQALNPWILREYFKQ